MDRTRALATGSLVVWAGRLLLLGGVLFWWGGVLVPNLVSLAFPAWLPPESIPRDLNPEIDWEGRLANRVSAAALLVLAVVAIVSAEVSRRRTDGWIVVAGWTVLAGTAAFLFWEETSDFHATELPGLARSVFSEDVLSQAGTFIWVLMAIPLIAGFLVAMAGFYFRGLRTSDVRKPFALGLGAWLLALLCEGMTPALIKGRAYGLMVVLEETLEFGGSLLLALSAVAVWARRDAIARAFHGHSLRAAVIASATAVVVLGGLFAALAFQAPTVDARATGGHEVYWVSLADQQSVAQELQMPAEPISRVSLRLANRDLEGRTGAGVWRVMDAPEGASGRVLRAGRVDVPAGDLPVWVDVDVPLLSAPEDRRLLLQVVAEVEPGSALRIGMVQGNRYEEGRLWVNGELTWPEQDLEFVAHGAVEPTRSKLGTLWHLFTSDWRWAALGVKAFVALVMVTLIPVLLTATAWRGSRVGGIPSGLR